MLVVSKLSSGLNRVQISEGPQATMAQQARAERDTRKKKKKWIDKKSPSPKKVMHRETAKGGKRGGGCFRQQSGLRFHDAKLLIFPQANTSSKSMKTAKACQ